MAAQHRRAQAFAAAAQRQVPVGLAGMATGARAERLARSQAMPQAQGLIGVGRADAQHGIVVLPRGQRVTQQQQGHVVARGLLQRLLQRAGMGERILGVPQRLAPGAQGLGARGMAARAAGLQPQPCHEQRDDGVDQQHRAEQQRVLTQVNREGPSRRHEEPVEAQHGQCAAGHAGPGRQPQGGERADQHQRHRQAGEIDVAVQPGERGHARTPQGQRNPVASGHAPGRTVVEVGAHATNGSSFRIRIPSGSAVGTAATPRAPRPPCLGIRRPGPLPSIGARLLARPRRRVEVLGEACGACNGAPAMAATWGDPR